MSKWQEEKDERNRRSLARLAKSLPDIFPPVVLSRALSRTFVPPTPRLAIDCYWGAHPLRADHLARALAARSGAPSGWSWRLSDNRKSGLPTTFRIPPRPIGNAPTHGVRVSAMCAGNRFIDSVGMSICGTQGPTGTRSGTARALSHGNSGLRLVTTRGSCGACKHGAAAKPEDCCGRTPKLIIISRCFECGANTGMCCGQRYSIIGAYQTFS
jgi:hypothetical protein